MYTKYFLLIIVLFIPYSSAQVPVFCIEGNVGAGKSTLLRALAKNNPEFVVVPEPIDKVTNVAGINLLQLFYNNIPRWAFTTVLKFHTAFIDQLNQTISSDVPHHICITDRSVYGTCYGFVTMFEKKGNMNAAEVDLYHDIFKLTSHSMIKPSGFIYLRTDPEVSHQRICSRDRIEEQNVSKEFWYDLHDAFENMLIDNKTNMDAISDVPVLIINANIDMYSNPDYLTKTIEIIENFIQNCKNKV